MTDPIAMLLFCPRCDRQHVCGAECETPSHRCGCAYQWRPSDAATVGVRALQTSGEGDRPAHPYVAKTQERPALKGVVKT